MLDKRKNHSLQILRATAAAMVVLAHLIERLIKYDLVDESWSDITRLGSKGVEIFFLISGFIVGAAFLKNLSVEKKPIEFIKRRFLRIAPSYYFWSFIMALKMMLVDKQTITLMAAIASAAFWPHYNDIGLIQPLYGLGWSLNFEMYFYAVLAIALIIPGKKVAIVSVFFIILVPILLKFQQPDFGNIGSTALKFYGTPVALYFLIGFILAMFKNKCPSFFLISKNGFNAFTAVLLAVLAVYFVGYVSLIFTCLCVGFAVFEKNGVKPSKPIIFGSFLGDASFSIYLTHSFVLGPLVAVYRVVGGSSSLLGISLLIIVSLIISALMGVMAYVFVEKKLGALLGRARLSKVESRG